VVDPRRSLYATGATEADYSNARERISSLSDESAEWTFTNLRLGGALIITIWLDVAGCRPDEIVNRLELSGRRGSNDPLSNLATLRKEGVSVWRKAESEVSSFEWTALGVVAISGKAIPAQPTEKIRT